MQKLLLGDAQLKLTTALPNGAVSVTSLAIDLNQTTNGDFFAQVDLLISVPAQVFGVLADTATLKFDVLTSANSDLSSPVTLAKEVLVQTGAGGVGAAAKTARFRFAEDVLRYVGVKASNSGAGNASGSNMTTQLVF